MLPANVTIAGIIFAVLEMGTEGKSMETESQYPTTCSHDRIHIAGRKARVADGRFLHGLVYDFTKTGLCIAKLGNQYRVKQLLPQLCHV